MEISGWMDLRSEFTKQRDEAELEVAKFKMLLFSLGVTRIDKNKNEYVKRSSAICIGDKAREARLRCSGT